MAKILYIGFILSLTFLACEPIPEEDPVDEGPSTQEATGTYSDHGFSFTYDSEIFISVNEESFEGGDKITLQGENVSFIIIARELSPVRDFPVEAYLPVIPDEGYGIENGELVNQELPFYDNNDDTYDLVLEEWTIGELSNYLKDPGKYYAFALSFKNFQTADTFFEKGKTSQQLFSELMTSIEFNFTATLQEKVSQTPYCGELAMTVIPNFEAYGQTIQVAILCPEFWGEDFFQEGKDYDLTVSPFEQFSLFDKEDLELEKPLYWNIDLTPSL